jgi:hypothetical protein
MLVSKRPSEMLRGNPASIGFDVWASLNDGEQAQGWMFGKA